MTRAFAYVVCVCACVVRSITLLPLQTQWYDVFCAISSESAPTLTKYQKFCMHAVGASQRTCAPVSFRVSRCMGWITPSSDDSRSSNNSRVLSCGQRYRISCDRREWSQHMHCPWEIQSHSDHQHGRLAALSSFCSLHHSEKCTTVLSISAQSEVT